MRTKITKSKKRTVTEEWSGWISIANSDKIAFLITLAAKMPVSRSSLTLGSQEDGHIVSVTITLFVIEIRLLSSAPTHSQKQKRGAIVDTLTCLFSYSQSIWPVIQVSQTFGQVGLDGDAIQWENMIVCSNTKDWVNHNVSSPCLL